MASGIVEQLASRDDTEDPEALAAWIGKSKFQKMAKEGGSKNWKTLGKQAFEKRIKKGQAKAYEEKYGKK